MFCNQVLKITQKILQKKSGEQNGDDFQNTFLKFT